MTPIARLVPYQEQVEGFQVVKAIHPAREPRKVRGVRLRKPVDVVRLLRESREER